MKVSIQVANREEGDLIKAGLADQETFAFVKIIGALSALPSRRAKSRCLWFVRDLLLELSEQPDAAPSTSAGNGQPRAAAE